MTPDQILHAYTRVSSASQEEEGTSLDTQKELGLKKSEELGLRFRRMFKSLGSENFYHGPIQESVFGRWVVKGHSGHGWSQEPSDDTEVHLSGYGLSEEDGQFHLTGRKFWISNDSVYQLTRTV